MKFCVCRIDERVGISIKILLFISFYHKMYQISCHFNQLTVEHCSRMTFFKFVLILVIISIQNSYSFGKSAKIPGDCKDIECIAKLLREQKKIQL